MSRLNVKEANPTRYAMVKEEQEAIRRKYAGGVMLAKLCPYCNHKIEMIQRGFHGATSAKCSSCGEIVYFPPIYFRRSKN